MREQVSMSFLAEVSPLTFTVGVRNEQLEL